MSQEPWGTTSQPAAPDPVLPPPSWADATVARASAVIGGPWGRRAANGSRWVTPLRVILLLAGLTLILAYVQKSPCANGDWTGNKQYTHVCYSDVIPLWSAERLDVGNVPYRDNAVEYPVLVGGFMWLTSGLTEAAHQVLGSVSSVELFGALTCLLLAGCALAVVAGTVGAAGRRPYDAAIFALSPLLVFHAFSNWDLLAMAFASSALWAWARQRPVAAGVLIGLGTAAKLYPIFLLVPIVILAIRTGRYRQACWCTVSAVVAWLAVNVPISWAYFDGWKEFYTFSDSRSAEASTIWYMGHYLATVGLGGGSPTDWTPPGWAVAFLLLVALAIVVMLGIGAPTRPRIGQLAFLAVLAFLLTTKVWSPQYSLWLVPLVALARPRWRLNLLWQFSEIAVWIMTLLLLLGYIDTARSINYGWLMLVLLIRDGFLLALAGLVVYEMWNPNADVVRASGLDDPAGGVYDGAPDALRLVRRRG
ncbi:MAG TPA: glycosyltransferase 87 family protein [Jatrophihabitantaceae bacterium]|jgi:uncharacterized membrane protein|nr:glycosyltransferase 87 family protein [Jatrophihabitantaceae bacterium]